MSRKSTKRLVATGAFIAALVFGPPAQATHDWHLFYDYWQCDWPTAVYYPCGRWSSGDRTAVTIYIENNITGSFYNRVLNGATTWDNEAQSFNFSSKGSTAPITHDECATGYRNHNVVYQSPIGNTNPEEDIIAQTGLCLTNTNGVVTRLGLLQVQLTAVVTDHAASTSSSGSRVNASSNSTGVSLPSPR